MYKLSLLLLALIVHLNLYSLEVDQMSIVLDANEAPPFFSKDLPHNGMAGEIIYEVSKAAGIKSEINFKPLSRMIKEDENNDLGNPAFFINNQDFASIITIAQYYSSFYYYSDSKNDKQVSIESLSDLKGSKIGILKGSLMETLFFEEKGVEFETSYSQESLFKKLKLKRLDYVLEVRVVGEHIISKLFPSEKENFIAVEIKKSVNPISIMLSEEQKDVKLIAQAYRRGLKKIIDNGVYEKVLNRYHTSKPIDKHWLKQLKKFDKLYKMESDE